MTIAELIPVWEGDMRKIVPEFQLLRADRMARAVEAVRDFYGEPDATELEICCRVLRTGSEGKTGIPAAWWWITASLNIFAADDIASNPWYEVCWWVFEQSRGKRETNTLWGAASCGKTEFFGALSWTNMVVWGHEAYVYITSPWKTHGSDKIWSTLTKRAKKWLADTPDWMVAMGLELKSNADEITLTDQLGNEAVARFVSLEGAASITGKKRSKTDDLFTINPKQGLMLLISDELAENPVACAQFLEGEANYMSNANAMGFVAFNPKPHNVQHANVLPLSAPVDIPVEVLSRDADFSWRTTFGKLVRLCIANSPNAPCGDTPIFPFLINKVQAEAQARRGELAKAAQVEAWGWGEGDNGCELTPQDCSRPDRQDPPAWIAPPMRVLYIDPAFGGRDAASYTCLEFGIAMVDNVRKQIVSGVEQGVLPITRQWTPTVADVEEFNRLVQHYGGRVPDTLKAGQETSSSNLVVLLSLRAAVRLGIQRGYLTYDGSQRVDVALPMNLAFKHVPWYYEGSRKLTDEEGENWMRFPVKRNPSGEVAKWSDEVSRPISMIWRFAERVISRGHMVGLSKMQKGLAEIRGRRWVTTKGTGRVDLEGKMNLSVSPTYGEGIAIALYFAIRFCGALPDLFSHTAESGDVVSLSDPLFRARGRRLDRSLYR